MTDPTTPLFDFQDLPSIKELEKQLSITAPAASSRKVMKAEKFRRLSKILKLVPATECHLILQNWSDAIVAGTVRAVPFKGQQFSKTIIDKTGQETMVEVQDELVEMAPQFEAWLAQQRQEARYAVLSHHGEIATTPDRLKRHDDDFDRLLQARVQRLQGNQSGRKTGRKQG